MSLSKSEAEYEVDLALYAHLRYFQNILLSVSNRANWGINCKKDPVSALDELLHSEKFEEAALFVKPFHFCYFANDKYPLTFPIIVKLKKSRFKVPDHGWEVRRVFVTVTVDGSIRFHMITIYDHFDPFLNHDSVRPAFEACQIFDLPDDVMTMNVFSFKTRTIMSLALFFNENHDEAPCQVCMIEEETKKRKAEVLGGNEYLDRLHKYLHAGEDPYINK